ncbi:hypothetical protein [Ferruginibacter albus]|uniref:hypothetical protein n=1 Tax=Ferruginibacter albus TaxID=2875540 RepID=UPI001CC7B43F|nr:hypothetical protein [Ferruginibacter albus]UAY51786.1 hypothetical protein K9M53_14470 [Ferruginibacter albus]
MKKTLSFLIIYFSLSVCSAQESLPSYPTILRYYFSRHPEDGNYENVVNFAKKKDGWFLQRINQVTHEVSSERPYWLKKDKTFIDTVALLKDADEDIEKNVTGYLGSGTNIYDWYSYERCPYYGYNGWDVDVIKDFEDKKNLSDTILDGLLRAYGRYSGRYTWYQYGGDPLTNDTLQRKLSTLELPSSARIDKAVYYLQKSIETAKRLRALNPDYVTLVGNADLKVFNEQMKAYSQMTMALQDKKAKEFIVNTELDSPYILQAKNYLNSCPPNTILFTYGDNDTYPLWYVQEKENYRKDVSVINTSLLSMPVYLDMLKKTNAVTFTTDADQYGKKFFEVFYFSENKSIPKYKSIPLSSLLNTIRNRTYHATFDDSIASYPYKQFVFDDFSKLIDESKSSFQSDDDSQDITTEPIIQLNSYLLNGDFMVFDIINENAGIRPIYFTTATYTGYFNDWLQQNGICYHFASSETLQDDSAKTVTEDKLENFVQTIYKTPLIIYNGHKTISFDGNNTFFPLYSTIANFYLTKDDKDHANYWLNKALDEAHFIATNNIPAACMLMGPLADAGNNKKAKELCELYATYIYNKYNHPSAIEGYLSKKDCYATLTSLRDFLEGITVDNSMIKKLMDDVERN